MKTHYSLPLIALLTVILASPLATHALPVSAASSTTNVTKVVDKLQKERAKGDTAITNRLNDLNALLVKISDMKNVSSMFTDRMNSMVQSEKDNLNNLKSQIDTEASSTALKGEVGSITKSFRIYALVIPQANVAATADKVKNVGAMIAAVGDKIAVRINDNAFVDMTALQTKLTDLKSRITDADTLADQAISITAVLKPDDGDKTTLDANNTALKQARDYLKNAQQDIKTARTDLTDLLKGVKSSNATSTAATTTSTH